MEALDMVGVSPRSGMLEVTEGSTTSTGTVYHLLMKINTFGRNEEVSQDVVLAQSGKVTMSVSQLVCMALSREVPIFVGLAGKAVVMATVMLTSSIIVCRMLARMRSNSGEITKETPSRIAQMVSAASIIGFNQVLVNLGRNGAYSQIGEVIDDDIDVVVRGTGVIAGKYFTTCYFEDSASDSRALTAKERAALPSINAALQEVSGMKRGERLRLRTGIRSTNVDLLATGEYNVSGAKTSMVSDDGGGDKGDI